MFKKWNRVCPVFLVDYQLRRRRCLAANAASVAAVAVYEGEELMTAAAAQLEAAIEQAAADSLAGQAVAQRVAMVDIKATMLDK